MSRAGWNPSSDLALVELRVRDVGTRHTPLVGVFSREGWNHPGPLLFYALTAPYRLLGSRSGALLAGALLLNLCSLAGALLLLRHLGGRLLLAWGALLLALLTRALGGLFLVDPWNPRVAVLPLFTLALVAWWLAEGDARALPVGTAVGSFLVQSHVGYGLAVVTLLCVGIAAHVLGLRRSVGDEHRDGRRSLRRGAIVAAALGLGLWLPPLVAEITGGDNLAKLWRWIFTAASTTGTGGAWELVAPHLSWRPPWITGHEPLDYLVGAVRVGDAPLPVALVALTAAGAVGWHRRDRSALHAIAVAAATVGGAVVSIAQVRGVVYSYLTQWLWVVGPLCWLAIGWALLRALPERVRGKAEGIGAPVTLAVAAALAVLPAWQVIRRPTPEPHLSVAISAVSNESLRDLRGCDQVSITPRGGTVGYFAVPGFALQLERHGYEVLLDTLWSDRVGIHRTRGFTAAECALVFASGDAVEKMATETGLAPIARYDSHTPAERRADDEFQAHFDEVMSIPDIALDDPRVQRIQRELERRSHLPPVVHVAVYRTR